MEEFNFTTSHDIDQQVYNDSHNYTNETAGVYIDPDLYKYYVPAMLLFCLISVIVNIRVLMAVRWIRRPLSPTLHISLSLAAADAFTSMMLGTGLLMNSYLPVVFHFHASCIIHLTMEMYRLSGVIITVVHLLALSVNHYLGILKPLQYNAIMTSKRTTIVVVFLWIGPVVFFKTYFFVAADEGYWETGCTRDTFANDIKFRGMFSCLFFVPIVLMIVFYTHILILVKKQQRVWEELSRSGSTRYRGSHNSRHGIRSQQRQMEGNVKAIFTTLLILGSCVVGWVPAVITYIIVCSTGCPYSGPELRKIQMEHYVLFFYINFVVNLLIILKTLANPIIYSFRMAEIKEGTRRMHVSMSRLWGGSRRAEARFISHSQQSQGVSSSMRTGMTAICRLNRTASHRSNHTELGSTLL